MDLVVVDSGRSEGRETMVRMREELNTSHQRLGSESWPFSFIVSHIFIVKAFFGFL